MYEGLIRSEERVDDLQYGGFRLIQNPDLFCFSTDSVLLSAFVKVPAGSTVVDLGAGSGILTVLMYSRQKKASYTAIEIQPELYDLLVRNLALNMMDNEARAILGDIREAPHIAGTHNDICVCNPPYEKAQSGAASKNAVHEKARREILITFGEMCQAASKCLRTGGRLYVVHRAYRLAELFSTMRGSRLEPKQLQLVAGAPGKEPRTCLIMAQKDGCEGMRVLPQITLLDENGAESTEMRVIYRRDAT